jgi:translation initiation factor 2 beta subunit (eIF-2beta)/eIF-5
MSFITEKRDDIEMPLCLAYGNEIDPYYRYTICKLAVRTRDAGKMKRTYFENLDTIATKLNVPPSIISQFFAYSLSVSCHHKGTPSISGCFTTKELNDVFKRFLRSMTLCGRCRLLETDICVRKKRGEVYLRCQACGHRTELSKLTEIPDKYVRYLLKTSATMPRRKLSTRSSNTSDKTKVPDTEVVWLTDTSDEAVKQRLQMSHVSTVDRLLS